MPTRFRALTPDYYDEAAFVAAAQTVLTKTEADFKQLFAQTVEGWDHKVNFESSKTINGEQARLVYGTDDEIYGYVNDGTKPHDIQANGAKPLRFKTGYRAKTRRGSLQSGSGGASGPWRSARKVRHPGTQAREFDSEVVRRVKPKFEGYVTEEIERATLKRKARP